MHSLKNCAVIDRDIEGNIFEMFQMQYSKYWAANDSFFTVSRINVYIVNKYYLDTLGFQVRKMKMVFINISWAMKINRVFFALVI